MMREGDMVRASGGPMMKITHIYNGMVRCIFVNGHGQVRQRFHYRFQLSPAWLSLQPRTAWPEMGQLELIEIEREEREARVAKVTDRAKRRKNKRSNKIKRGLAQ